MIDSGLFPMPWSRVFWVVLGIFFCGCASDNESSLLPLTRQQGATIESLQTEVTRLNQELEDTADSRETLESIKSELGKVLADEILKEKVLVFSERRGLVVTVFDQALFDPEETRLLPAGEEILDKLSKFLSSQLSENKIRVEGHTDNQPVEGNQGISNWEYSVGRATAVLHYFLNLKGLAPERFSISGYGEYVPLVTNDTAEGRARNRRVEIVISPSKITGIRH